jgi:hypothetical protein
MYRTAYTEEFMAKLAFQSLPVWDELEEEAGQKLRMMSGLLNFGDRNYGVRQFVPTCLTSLLTLGLGRWP